MKHVRLWRNAVGEDEVQQLVSAMTAQELGQGAVTAEFEERLAALLDVPYAVATTSGSVALLMALMACDIGERDEVILPNRASIAAAHAPVLLGARLRVIDVEPERPTLSASKIFSCLSRRTKAVIVPHPAGRCGNMEAVRQIADEYDLLVVEDAAEALGSRAPRGPLGTLGDVGCFSLGMTKLISSGQGGVVVTQDERIYHKLLVLRNHGHVPGEQGQAKEMGFNFKFSDMQAAIGLGQLKTWDKRAERVRRIYQIYADALESLPFLKLLPLNVEEGELPLYVEALCEERERLTGFLDAQGIETQPLNPSLDRCAHLRVQGDFPNSGIYDSCGLRLPCGPGQSLEDIRGVLEAVARYEHVCYAAHAHA